MTKKILVSVGIPAYNEGANIKYFLLSLLAQKAENFILKEIIVISDGSTDRTVHEALSMHDGRVRVLERYERRGQALRQNEIFERVDTDFVVVMNADVLPQNERFLEEMVKAYQRTPNAGIVAAKVVPLPSNTYLGRILDWHMQWKTRLYENINNGDTIYLCHGRARGFSRRAYTQIHWPQIWSEDSYSYLVAKKLGLRFVYCDSASVLYRSPQTLNDHVRQSVRFLRTKSTLARFFAPREITKSAF